jgi:hypothetical protein
MAARHAYGLICAKSQAPLQQAVMTIKARPRFDTFNVSKGSFSPSRLKITLKFEIIIFQMMNDKATERTLHL